MTASGMIYLVWKAVRGRMLETLLLVFGVALTVGVGGSALAMMKFFQDQSRPDQSTLDIRVSSNSGPGARPTPETPFVRVQEDGTSEVMLDARDLEAAKAVSPHVKYAFVQAFIAMRRVDSTAGAGAVPQKDSAVETGAVVLGDYFQAAGLTVAVGSTFSKSDEASGAKVAVLGSALAALQFPDGNAIGKTASVFGQDFRVVGVLAPIAISSQRPIKGPEDPNLMAYIPAKAAPMWEKMKILPDLTFSATDIASVRQAADELRAYFDSKYGTGTVSVEPSISRAETEMKRNAGVFYVILLLAAGGLLIAALNILNLMIARVLRRTKTIAIFVAVGSTRRSVFRQALLESAVFAVAGGIVGIAIALGLSELLRGLLSGATPEFAQFHADVGSLGIALAVALAVNLAFGAYPASLAARANVSDALRQE